MKELQLRIGAVSDSIRIQLDQQGLTYVLKDVETFQRSADAISFLWIKDLLPAGQVEKSRARLFKQIQQHVNKHNKP